MIGIHVLDGALLSLQQRVRIGNVGQKLRGREVAAGDLDLDGGEAVLALWPDVGRHEPVELAGDGEILVRGAIVMRAYRLDPIRSADAIDGDGWFHTGDVGAVDAAGRVAVVDRLKDLVITGGVNVSPAEVEAVLGHHPDVNDVCVVGVPDDEWGEVVVAFVVPRAGARPPSIEELRAFGRAQLSGPKLPRAAHVVDAIPRTMSGKALRRRLRETITTEGVLRKTP